MGEIDQALETPRRKTANESIVQVDGVQTFEFVARREFGKEG